MELHVRFLSRAVTEKDLEQIFEPFGKISTTTIVRDEPTGEPIGLGVVDMPNEQEAREAARHLAQMRDRGRPVALDEQRTGVGRRLGLDRRGDERKTNDRRIADRRDAVRLGISLA